MGTLITISSVGKSSTKYSCSSPKSLFNWDIGDVGHSVLDVHHIVALLVLGFLGGSDRGRAGCASAWRAGDLVFLFRPETLADFTPALAGFRVPVGLGTITVQVYGQFWSVNTRCRLGGSRPTVGRSRIAAG